ncbi:MAG: carbon monoxide dehydrogenase large subunit [Hyphomicrobiales bacterium]|nr:carbon monoxide dehydrogenase large subunit [Hyphomicrobiales bacterium]
MRETQFGASALRKEDAALLIGKGRFVDDVKLPGMTFAAFVRSPHAHATITRIDVSAAKALPGVVDVITHADLPEPMRSRRLPLYVPNPHMKQVFMPTVLADDEVCFVGEAIAIVIAESRYIAEDAAILVEIDYGVLPASIDPLSAIAEGAPLAQRTAKSNIVTQVPITFGDTDAAFAGAAHVFKERFFMHRGGPFFLECRGVVASWDVNSEQLTMYASSQGSHRFKRTFVDLLDFDENQVRVITNDVGGGFGPKGSFYVEYAATAAAAMIVGRPVKWIEDRRENFVSTQQERDQYWDMEVAVDGHAKLLGLRGRLVHDGGAYVTWGLVLPWIAATSVIGPYVLPNYRLELIVAMTNKITCSPVRGAGRPQGCFVMERMMDRIARELNLDRAEVRRRNFIKPEQMPYKVGLTFRDGKPAIYDSGDYPRSQQMALDHVDYESFESRRLAALKEGRYIGLGISNAVEGTGLGPYEGATIRISTSGKVVVYTGATPQGQSHKTTLAQIASDHLGIGIDDINVVTGDTGTIPFGMGTFASRTAVNAGSSVHLAGIEIVEKIKKVAADMLEVSPDDLELKDGGVEVRGIPGMRKTFRELANNSVGLYGFSMKGDRDPGLEATSYFKPEQSTYANSSHVAEVEVDIETGHVKVTRVVVNHDCGRVINPMIVEGQIVGGVAHGIGNALFEQLLFDENGQPLTTSFAEYLLPMAPDVPNVEVIHTVSPSPLNPIGVKGAGEGGTIAVIAAIISAIENALKPFDARLSEMPISPEKIVRIVNTARAASA